jgi:multidrug efflux pump
MLTATGFGIFFIPLFYLAVRRWVTKKRPLAPEEIAHHQAVDGAHA